MIETKENDIHEGNEEIWAALWKIFNETATCGTCGQTTLFTGTDYQTNHRVLVSSRKF